MSNVPDDEEKPAAREGTPNGEVEEQKEKIRQTTTTVVPLKTDAVAPVNDAGDFRLAHEGASPLVPANSQSTPLTTVSSLQHQPPPTAATAPTAATVTAVAAAATTIHAARASKTAMSGTGRDHLAMAGEPAAASVSLGAGVQSYSLAGAQASRTATGNPFPLHLNGNLPSGSASVAAAAAAGNLKPPPQGSDLPPGQSFYMPTGVGGNFGRRTPLMSGGGKHRKQNSGGNVKNGRRGNVTSRYRSQPRRPSGSMDSFGEGSTVSLSTSLSSLSNRRSQYKRPRNQGQTEEQLLTNPLLAMVPHRSVLGPYHPPAATAMTSNNGLVDGGSMCSGTVPAAELMNSADLVFHPPNTYPISFLARLLGFEVPEDGSDGGQNGNVEEETVASTLTLAVLPQCSIINRSEATSTKRTGDDGNIVTQDSECESNDKNAINQKRASQALPSNGSIGVPDPRNLRLQKNDIFLQVPPEGRYHIHQRMIEKQSNEKTLKLKRKRSLDTVRDLDDRLLEHVDPLYQALVQGGWDLRRMTPATDTKKTSLRGLILQKEQKQGPIREKVVELAREFLHLSPDWSFQDWTSFAAKTGLDERRTQQQQKESPQRQQQQRQEQVVEVATGDKGSVIPVADGVPFQDCRPPNANGLTKEAVDYLTEWAQIHIEHPYPNADDRSTMMQDTGLTKQQILHWFKSYRSRHWDPSRKKGRHNVGNHGKSSGNLGYVSAGDLATASVVDDEIKSTPTAGVEVKNDRTRIMAWNTGSNYPQWTVDGMNASSMVNQFGILACYKGEPVAVLKYNFQWYQLAVPESSIECDLSEPATGCGMEENPGVESNTSKPSATEAELVMVVNGIVLRANIQVPSKQQDSGVSLSFHQQFDQSSSTADVGLQDYRLTEEMEIKRMSPVAVGMESEDGRRNYEGLKSASRQFLPVPISRTAAAETHALSQKSSTEDRPKLSLASSTARVDDRVRLVMLALAHEHTRACNVWYSLWDTPESFVETNRTCFRMVESARNGGTHVAPLPLHNGMKANTRIKSPGRPMVADLNKCSSQYAILRMRDWKEGPKSHGEPVFSANETSFLSERLLVHLPSYEGARSCFQGFSSAKHPSTRAAKTSDGGNVFCNSVVGAKGHVAQLQVAFDGEENSHVHESSGSYRGNELSDIGPTPKKMWPSISSTTNSTLIPVVDAPKALTKDQSTSRNPVLLNPNETSTPPSGPKEALYVEKDVLQQQDKSGFLPFEILHHFPIPNEATAETHQEDNEVLNRLMKKQQDLVAIESEMEPRVRYLLVRTVEESAVYEQLGGAKKRFEEVNAVKEHDELVIKRTLLDQVCQEQLEEELNAVCSICDDGEVTTDNQILFCDACNVAVHQMCYGIEVVPEGDYYCIPCRHFERDKVMQRRATFSAPRASLPPLPVACELCPLKHGAFTRSHSSKSAPNSSVAKWVHMSCAKWQGVDFQVPGKPELVDDVAELKAHFLRLGVSCFICRGRRGAYNKCRHEGCQNWLHVSCARASGLCEVIHGEDVNGMVTDKPWTLLCPEHSQTKKADEDMKRKRIPIEQLIHAANEFPPDPVPPPPRQKFKPFNKLSGTERAAALADRKYEDEFIEEVINKKRAGVRCEVCDMIDDNSLSCCISCGVFVCFSCQLSDDVDAIGQRYFNCFGCRFVAKKESQLARNEVPAPQCKLCNQKGGLLLHASGTPLGKHSYWKRKQSDFERSLFTQLQWSHFACAFWSHQDIRVEHKDCTVDCSNVIMSNGRGFVLGNNRCGLCGLRNGLKAKCADPSCRARGERQIPYHFHVTCARQAGFEVAHDENRRPEFYVHCYIHGGNENNLRARLEDLIESERRRAGKMFYKSTSPMTFNDGCRLLNGAILVMRILGWAWRWAEWWVEYGSSWEPLLEPGQIESEMTDEQLRIVESSPESRRENARRCRLAPLGAALRNRAYDLAEGFDTPALDRALRAVLHTPSLVGPLDECEIDFFADWLGRAYRSKSRLLGFGPDKIPVANDAFCAHLHDGSPKYELGNRPLPGKDPLPPNQYFENPVSEPDDFLQPETTKDGDPIDLKPFDEVEYKRRRGKRGEQLPSDEGKQKRRHPSSRREGEKREAVLPEPPGQVNVPPCKNSPTARMEISDSPAACQIKEVSAGNHANENQRRKRQRAELVSRRMDEAFPVVEAEIPWEDIDNEDSILRTTRRGRPPRTVRLAMTFRVDGQDYHPRLSDTNVSFSKDDPSTPSEQVRSRTQDMNGKPVGFQSPRKRARTCHYVAEPASGRVNGLVVGRRREKQRSQVRASSKSRRNEDDVEKERGHRSSSDGVDRNIPDDEYVNDLTITDIFPSGNRNKFVKNIGWTARNLLSFSIRDAAREYVIWRRDNGLPAVAEGGAEREMRKMKSKVKEALDERIAQGESEDCDLEEAAESSDDSVFDEDDEDDNTEQKVPTSRGRLSTAKAALPRKKSIVRGSQSEREAATKRGDKSVNDQVPPNGKLSRSRKRKNTDERSGRSLQKKGRVITEPMEALSDLARKFANSVGLKTARAFLEMRSRDYASKYVEFRRKEGLLELSGTSISATLSTYKTRVRDAAIELGYDDLASIDMKSPGLSKKTQRNSELSLPEFSYKENDFCMYCGEPGDLIICDGCDQSCHPLCIDPPMMAIPEGDWFCPKCSNKQAPPSKIPENDIPKNEAVEGGTKEMVDASKGGSFNDERTLMSINAADF